MRKTMIKLLCRVSIFLALFCMYAGAALCEIVYYINPNGGIYYHLDQNCPRVHAKYLPLQGVFHLSELNEEPSLSLKPCQVCGAPQRPED